MRFRWGFDEDDELYREMKLEQIMALYLRGVAQFMVACDPGVGLYSAEIINLLRETDAELQLYCVLPREEQATNRKK